MGIQHSEAGARLPRPWRANHIAEACVLLVSPTRMRSHFGEIAQVARWSRERLEFVSGGADSHVIVWDISSGEAALSIETRGIVSNVQFSPRNSSLILIDAVGALPAILDTTTGHMAPIDIPSLSREPEYPHHDPRSGDTQGTAAADYCFASCFHPDGERVFVGSHTGHIYEYDIETKSILRAAGLADRPSSLVKRVSFSSNGNVFVVSQRSALYVYDTSTGAPPAVIKSPVDLKVAWKAFAVSPDGSHIAAGSAQARPVRIHIYNVRTGVQVTVLEGAKTASLLDMQWHPARPSLVSVDSNGVAGVWETERQDSWSSFAPDFKEIDYNVVHYEQEDEFDEEGAEDLDGSRPADGHVGPAEDEIDVCGGVDADGMSTCHLPGNADVDLSFLRVDPEPDAIDGALPLGESVGDHALLAIGHRVYHGVTCT